MLCKDNLSCNDNGEIFCRDHIQTLNIQSHWKWHFCATHGRQAPKSRSSPKSSKWSGKRYAFGFAIEDRRKNESAVTVM